MQSFEVIPISRISWNVQFDNVLQEPTRDPDVWPAPAPKDPQVSHELSSVWPSRSRFWPIHGKCPRFICILQGMGSSYTFCSSRLSWLWWCSSCKGAAEEHQVKNLGSIRSIWFGVFHHFFIDWLCFVWTIALVAKFFCSSDSGPARGGGGRNVKGGDLPNRWPQRRPKRCLRKLTNATS